MRRFVYQKNHNDCAIATIATMVNKSYTEVIRKSNYTGSRGLTGYEILELINYWGKWRFKVPRRYWTLKEWAIDNPFCVAMVRQSYSRSKWHVVSVVNGEIFCSDRGLIANSQKKVWLSIIPNN